MKQKMKKIYIVLTYTGTILSRIIKLYTKAEFSHVSIALDSELKEMYSFGRLNPYNPFIGGFVHEGIGVGTFKRFKNTKTEIYSFELTIKQYNRLKKMIKKMNYEKSRYGFNIIGLFASAFNIKIRKQNCFYCSEFVKYLIEKCRLGIELPKLIKPNDFKKIDSLNLIYKGNLREYNITCS